MNLTSNFDYCIELGIDSVKEIFHLAFKSEDRYPHNVGPFDRLLDGHTVTVEVRVLDDDTDAADLRFTDDKHITFSFPFEITATTPDAPDPALGRVTMKARIDVAALLDTWPEEGEQVLGLSFFNVTAADVNIVSLEGLPSFDVNNFAAAVHSKYASVPHQLPPSPPPPAPAPDTYVILYDGNRDVTLVPPNIGVDPSNSGSPLREIQVALETYDGVEYVKLRAPIFVHALLPYGLGVYESYGWITCWRPIARTDSTITVDMTVEPGVPAPGKTDLRTTVSLDTNHPAKSTMEGMMVAPAVQAIATFGVVSEPAFSDAGARSLMANEVAAYLVTRRYPVYSPKSGNAAYPLSDPVGFLLPGDGVLAVLLNRRDASVADSAPENFLGTGQLALAVGRARVDERIAQAIYDNFGDLSSQGYEVSNDDGSATLTSLSVVPCDAGDHDQDVGHLWATGSADVHIDCWPDPTANFEGPIYIDSTVTSTDEDCSIAFAARAGDFDIDESCCDVFLDIIIPIVGWIVLAIVESTLHSVGGQLISDITGSQGEVIAPIPPTINGIAEVSGCLTGLTITSRGFILPGTVTIRRLGTSFDDLSNNNDQPKP